MEQLLEFGRKYISFSVTTVTRAEVPAVKQLAPIFTQQARRDCLPPEHTPVLSCIPYVHVHDIVLYTHVQVRGPEACKELISKKIPTDRPPAGDPKKPGTDNFFRVA